MLKHIFTPPTNNNKANNMEDSILYCTQRTLDRESEVYDLTDSENPFYLEAKRLLNEGLMNRFNIFIKWASGEHFDLAEHVASNPEMIDMFVYGVGEDEARTIATNVLESYNDEIMARLESNTITHMMEY
jgi:hypothetical protein